MRRKIAAGNWKMNKTPQEAKALIEELLPLVDSDDVDVIFCVPFIDIPVAIELLKGSRISVGAQNMHFEDKGAFTGEISAYSVRSLVRSSTTGCLFRAFPGIMIYFCGCFSYGTCSGQTRSPVCTILWECATLVHIFRNTGVSYSSLRAKALFANA